jgi:hypothetical protein
MQETVASDSMACGMRQVNMQDMRQTPDARARTGPEAPTGTHMHCICAFWLAALARMLRQHKRRDGCDAHRNHGPGMAIL